MTFAEKLAAIPQDVKKLRESLTIFRPNQVGFSNAGGREEGYRNAVSRHTRAEMVLECAKLIAQCKSGRRPSWHLKEAMTTSDFPNLFGDVLYRQLLGNYKPYPVTYPAYFRVLDAPDFRVLHLYAIDGAQGLLGPMDANGQTLTPVPIIEGSPYPETRLVETPYSIQVAKYGRRYGISWEMIINDDLNAFGSRPAMMAVGARRTEEYLATTMLADVNGPNANFFTAGNNNLLTNQLNVVGLQTGFTTIANQKDKDGQPIYVDLIHLVVPPSLKVTAENMLKASELRLMQTAPGNPGSGGTIDQFLYTANWMQAKVKLSVNSYIPYVSTSTSIDGVNPNGNRSWYMVADPNDLTSRPAFTFAFLQGRRYPQLFVRDSDARMLGGGDQDPTEGSFDNDTIDYKIRHCMGAAQNDPKMALASNGSGN